MLLIQNFWNSLKFLERFFRKPVLIELFCILENISKCNREPVDSIFDKSFACIYKDIIILL